MSMPTDLQAAERPGDRYVQSFARGLAVIRAFQAEAPQQTLTEVARRAGLTRAGARRILLTLESLGYVRSDGRLFQLTPKILDLGFAYLSSQPLWHHAEPLMRQLSVQLQESCSAAVLEGDDIVYVLRVAARRIMHINLGIGSRLPAWCTGMGRVLLAALPPDELEAHLARIAPALAQPRTPHTVRDLEQLRTRLSEVRTQGWCLLDQELEEGLLSLAAPIRDRQGRVIAALNISTSVSQCPVERLRQEGLPPLLHTAERISALLSGH